MVKLGFADLGCDFLPRAVCMSLFHGFQQTIPIMVMDAGVRPGEPRMWAGKQAEGDRRTGHSK